MKRIDLPSPFTERNAVNISQEPPLNQLTESEKKQPSNSYDLLEVWKPYEMATMEEIAAIIGQKSPTNKSWA